jgi:hypothetical protein
MKITVDYNEYKNKIENLKIIEAKYLSDFVIRISFNDSTEMLVDFKPFLQKSNHPSIKKYLDESKFSEYNIVDGNLNWNDYDMIFPIWDLYQGKI